MSGRRLFCAARRALRDRLDGLLRFRIAAASGKERESHDCRVPDELRGTDALSRRFVLQQLPQVLAETDGGSAHRHGRKHIRYRQSALARHSSCSHRLQIANPISLLPVGASQSGGRHEERRAMRPRRQVDVPKPAERPCRSPRMRWVRRTVSEVLTHTETERRLPLQPTTIDPRRPHISRDVDANVRRQAPRLRATSRVDNDVTSIAVFSTGISRPECVARARRE